MKFCCRIFFILLTCFLIHPYTNHAQVISATTDTLDLDGIQLTEMVDYIKGHSFSMEDYLSRKGFNKNNNSKDSYFYNEAAKSWIYLAATQNNNLLPKSIAALKQEYIAIKSQNSHFKATIEKIIYDLKTDDNFSVEIDYPKGEYNFYSIKKDFYIKILSAGDYNLIAVY
jgi:hypothetical protein